MNTTAFVFAISTASSWDLTEGKLTAFYTALLAVVGLLYTLGNANWIAFIDMRKLRFIESIKELKDRYISVWERVRNSSVNLCSTIGNDEKHRDTKVLLEEWTAPEGLAAKSKEFIEFNGLKCVAFRNSIEWKKYLKTLESAMISMNITRSIVANALDLRGISKTDNYYPGYEMSHIADVLPNTVKQANLFYGIHRIHKRLTLASSICGVTYSACILVQFQYWFAVALTCIPFVWVLSEYGLLYMNVKDLGDSVN